MFSKTQLVILIMLLVGCTSTQAEPTVTRPTTTPSTINTERPSATPSTTVTQIPVSTATAVPPTVTMLPTMTTATAVSPTSTPPHPTATKPAPEADIFHHITETSPDGDWIATSLLTFVTEPNPYSEYDKMVVGYQTTLMLEHQTNDTSWLVYSELQGAGMGYHIPTITDWSVDGQSVTFALVACADGGGRCGQSSPITVDLMTGTVQPAE